MLLTIQSQKKTKMPGNNKTIGEPNKNQQFQLNGRVVIHNIPEENTRDFGNMIKIFSKSKLTKI